MDLTKIPRYRSSKQVGAFQIRKIGGNIRSVGTPITEYSLFGKGGQFQTVPAGWHEKHQPQIGGYVVMYGVQEMHLSYCPMETFEAEHTYLQADRWQSHKEVHALQIRGLTHCERDHGSVWQLRFTELEDPLEVSETWYARHQPCSGGYYVVYRDGYTSYSPSQAFETGYTRIEPPVSETV